MSGPVAHAHLQISAMHSDVRIRAPTHRAADSVELETFAVHLGCILAASVGVMDESCGGPSAASCRIQGREREPRFQRVA